LEAPEVERGNRYSALRMTAKGQSRHSDRGPATSGLPPINRHFQSRSALGKSAKERLTAMSTEPLS
jgi:hypothetical protein